jgi:branched-chain amino acid transport system permease protein
VEPELDGPSLAQRFRPRPNVVLLLIIPFVLLYIPRLTDDVALIGVIVVAFAFVMFGATWDLLSGYTGQVNFGHAAFIGSGAYTVALMSKYHPDVPGELALVYATLAAAALGLLIGIPCLRLKGPYLALATLTAASALVQLTFIYKEQLEAEDGISGVKGVTDADALNSIGTNLSELVLGPKTFAGKDGLSQQIYVEYFVLLVFMVLMVGGLMLLAYGKRGLVLRSIQQDESAAEAAGVPVTRYKLAAFVLSAGLAGLAGGLLAMVRSSVALDLLAVDLSLLVIIIAAFGGVGSIIGPCVGAFIVILLQDFYLDKIHFFEQEPDLKLAAFALLLLVVLIVQPRGLVPPLLQKLSGRGSATAAAGKALEGAK